VSTTTSPVVSSPKRTIWPAVLVVALVAAVAAVALAVQSRSERSSSASPTLSGPADAPFRVAYPKSWHAVSASESAALPGSPLGVLRRDDGRGTVVITRRPATGSSAPKLARGLKRALSSRYTDFREIGAKVVSLHGRRALIYTFARTRTGTAQSTVIVAAGASSYALNAVVPPRSPDAAREVGAIIASFDARGTR
jgi:hypothetical protein